MDGWGLNSDLCGVGFLGSPFGLEQKIETEESVVCIFHSYNSHRTRMNRKPLPCLA